MSEKGSAGGCWFPTAQMALYALSLAVPATMWALVVLERADPQLSAYLTVALVICCWTGILVSPWMDGAATPVQRRFAIVLYWGLIGGLFPIVWDGTWVIANQLVNGCTAEDRWLWYWWSYARVDTRFLKSDHVMLIVETWSPLLGFAQLYAVHLLISGALEKAERLAWTTGWLQFYGCTLLFGMEVLGGHENITPGWFDCFMGFWLLNGFWIFMPFVACHFMSDLRSASSYAPPRSWINALRCAVRPSADQPRPKAQ
eukprot:TRINITY_DN4892_c0_g1_i4.p1 TRINITY_DN4892_c0_g1~~TRINITY_DN4892_c0_g1_i4.p1  ORF type:complete len:299 (-),score=62.04 TRINITY_DN4892_c0_g1_i4:65-838(-)